ncbi:MAG: hypothetical protein FWB77_02810 [Treponema sp.]|nr:hypothetical protein [Treponema sp.]
MKIKKIISGVFSIILVLIIPVFIFISCPEPEENIPDAAFNIENIGSPNLTITIDSNTKYQYVRGFGGMDSAWTSPKISISEYETMFDPNKLGYNMFRIMIPPGSTNISTSMNSVHNNYIAAVKIVNKYNGYVLASPWSPPAAWKSNNSINGGRGVHLKPENYQNYANYLKSFAQYMSGNGAPVYAISIQNEPNYQTDYDGCLWSPEQMRDFHKEVGRFTNGTSGRGGGKAVYPVKIMTGESANHPNINNAALDDPVSREAINLIGRHIYGNQQVRYAKALDHATDPKEVWMTEFNKNSGNASSYKNDYTWNYVWKFLNTVDLSIRLNDESAYIWWYSKRFYSLLGDGEYGSSSGAVLPRGYALSHYAKYAKEKDRIGVTVSGKTAGGVSVSAGSNFNNVYYYEDSVSARATAFMSPDGDEISIILFTPTNTSGSGGMDLGVVRINLPGNFTAASAKAIRSTSITKAGDQEVVLSDNKRYALVKMPAGNILSVRFEKE